MVFFLWTSTVGTLIVVGLVARTAVRVDCAHQAHKRIQALRRGLT
jgi:hypothetical protein